MYAAGLQTPIEDCTVTLHDTVKKSLTRGPAEVPLCSYTKEAYAKCDDVEGTFDHTEQSELFPKTEDLDLCMYWCKCAPFD